MEQWRDGTNPLRHWNVSFHPKEVNQLEGPTPRLEFLGFELDSQIMEIRFSTTMDGQKLM